MSIKLRPLTEDIEDRIRLRPLTAEPPKSLPEIRKDVGLFMAQGIGARPTPIQTAPIKPIPMPPIRPVTPVSEFKPDFLPRPTPIEPFEPMASQRAKMLEIADPTRNVREFDLLKTKPGAAIETGAGEALKGLVNLARLVNKPVSIVASELESFVTGKDIQPMTDPISRALERGVTGLEERIEQARRPLKDLTTPERVLFGAIQSVPQIAPALVGAPPVATTGFIGATAAGGAAREAELRGATIPQQFAFGIGSGGLEVATEYLPVSKLTKLAGGRGTFKDLTTSMLEEFVGEGISEALSPLIERSTFDPEAENATMQEILEAGATGATAALLMGGVSLNINKAKQAVENKDFRPKTLQEINQDIKDISGQDIMASQVDKADIKTMPETELKLELDTLGLDTKGTQTELRNNLKAARTEIIQPAIQQIQPATQPATQQIQPAIQPAIQPTIEPAIQPTIQPTIEPIEQIRPTVEPTAIQPIAPEAPVVDIDRGLKPSKFTQTAIKSDATGIELQRLLEQYPAYYQPNTEIAREAIAKEIIENNEAAAIALVKDGESFKSDTESQIGYQLVGKLQREGKFDEALEIIRAIAKKGSRAGQFVQQMAAWSKSTPEGMLKWADKELSSVKKKLTPELAERISTLMENVNGVNVDALKQILIDNGLSAKDVNAMSNDKLGALNTALAQKTVNVDTLKQILIDGGLSAKDVNAMSIDKLKALNTALTQKSVNVDTLKQILIDGGFSSKDINAMSIDKLGALNTAITQKVFNLESLKQRLIDGGLSAKDVNAMSIDRIKALNTALAQKVVVDRMPVSLARKVSTAQAISHLLNARTMLRNIFGNTSFALAENLSKVYGVGFDKVLSQKTGVKTTAIPKFLAPYQEAKKRFKASGQEIKLGVQLGQGKYDLFRGKTFKRGVLGKLEEMLSRGLTQPDEAFKGFIETQAIYSQVKARIGKKANNMTAEQLRSEATSSELAQAENEALYATFQDNSLPARILTGAKDLANKIGVGDEIVGASGTKTREFGLGDLLVKYTKVPGNIISRSVEYTPFGALKGLSLMNNAFKTGNAQVQREAANAFGRAFNGSSAIALAVWLASKGLLLSEDKDRKYDAKALDRAEGLGNYKINIDAINRLIDGKSGEPQKGDTLVSYNWNQPVATTFAIGAEINNQLSKNGFTPKALSDIIGRTSEEILDLPTLYIIKQMFYEGLSSDSTPLDIASVPLAQGASGFVPSVIRQVGQLQDPTFRETKGETQFETARKKVIGALPFARETLEPRLSPLGKDIQAETGIFETLISPGTITKFKPENITPFLKEVEDLTGEDVIFPAAKAPKTFTVNKEKIKLTDKERTIYQRKAGEVLQDEYDRLLVQVPDPGLLNQLQLQELVKVLEGIKRKSRDTAKQEIINLR